MAYLHVAAKHGDESLEGKLNLTRVETAGGSDVLDRSRHDVQLIQLIVEVWARCWLTEDASVISCQRSQEVGYGSTRG